jgi:DNA-directed RNA polymerase I, II, and III subunit RPABC1
MERERTGREGLGYEGEPLGQCLASFIDQGSSESHQYFLSRRTVLEMLKDRGYNVPHSDINTSLEEFRAVYGQIPDVDSLKFSVTHKIDPTKRMLVIFCGPSMLKVNSVRGIIGDITNRQSLAGLILILQSHITSQAMKALETLTFKVEIFKIADLLVNITKHVLKPKHHVLTDQEKQKLLQQYSIDEKQLPRLLKKDAIAKYYGLEKGQVVKVTYDDEIIESHFTYRCVS